MVRLVLVGGTLGLGLGAATTAAAVVAPGLRALARRALLSYATALEQTRASALQRRHELQELREEPEIEG